jgi:hypothetical protein
VLLKKKIQVTSGPYIFKTIYHSLLTQVPYSLLAEQGTSPLGSQKAMEVESPFTYSMGCILESLLDPFSFSLLLFSHSKH